MRGHSPKTIGGSNHGSPEMVKCPKCGEYNLTHRVCSNCGYYKGEEIVAKSAD